MARVERERALVVGEGEIELLEVPVRKSEEVVEVGAVRIAAFGDLQLRDRLRPVLRLHRGNARGVILVPLRQVRIGLFRIGERARREGAERASQQHGWKTLHRCATYA